MQLFFSMLKKAIRKWKKVKNLTIEERFDIIHSNGIENDVAQYITNKLPNLSIQIATEEEKNVIELMNMGKLNGWCWQTTESSIVFFEDDDFIERGNLKFSLNRYYWHSWICFKFKGKEFVFDPCLQIITDSSLYHHIFEASVQGSVTAKKVREVLIDGIQNRKEKTLGVDTDSPITLIFSADTLEKVRSETYIEGDNNLNCPMYRNHCGYIAIIEGDEIKSLFAHFYYWA